MFVNATAWAGDPTLSMTSFEIEPGNTYKATLDLVQGDIPVLAFQAELVLPEGLTIQGKPKAVSGTLTDEYGDPAEPTATFSNNKIVVYNSDGLTFNSDASAIVNFTFAASENFAGGSITLKDIVLSGEGNVKITPADVEVKVTVPAAPVQIEYPSLAMDNFEIEAGKTQRAALKLMQNGEKKILAFQCEFELPEGLTVQGKPKAVTGTLTDEFGDPAEPTVTFANSKVVVYNSDGYLFNVDAVDIVNFTFAADETFEAGIIKVKSIVLSAEGNEKIEPKEFEVKVNDPDGIAEIKASTTSDIFTLSGTRVSTMTRGLYIINGKKVVVK
jgi:hypothetical protein